MIESEEKKLDIILQYLHNQLNNQEKLVFFNLLKTETAFRALFAAEWRLYKELQPVKRKMSAAQKEHILKEVLEQANSYSAGEKVITKFIQELLSLILPVPVMPFIKIAKELSVSD